MSDLATEAARIADEELSAKEIRAIRNVRYTSGDWYVQDATLSSDLAHYPFGRLTELGLAVRDYLEQSA